MVLMMPSMAGFYFSCQDNCWVIMILWHRYHWCWHQCHVPLTVHWYSMTLMLTAMASLDQKVMLCFILIIWTLRNVMVPLTVPLALCGTSGIAWLKSHVFAPHFDNLNQRNAVVPLMMPLTSCDPVSCINCITWWKVMLHFSFIIYI